MERQKIAEQTGVPAQMPDKRELFRRVPLPLRRQRKEDRYLIAIEVRVHAVIGERMQPNNALPCPYRMESIKACRLDRRSAIDYHPRPRHDRIQRLRSLGRARFYLLHIAQFPCYQ